MKFLGGAEPDRFWNTGNHWKGEYPTSGSGGGYFPGKNVNPDLLVPGGAGVLSYSPVEDVITDPQGRRIGRLPDGTFVSEIPDAHHTRMQMDDGTVMNLFMLPAGRYHVSVHATGDGSFHLVTGGSKGAVHYGEQPIKLGQVSTVSFDSSASEGPLTLPDGTQVPAQREAAAPTVQVLPASEGSAFPAINAPLVLGVLGGVACIGIGITGVVMAVAMMRRSGSDKGVQAMRPPAPPAAARVSTPRPAAPRPPAPVRTPPPAPAARAHGRLKLAQGKAYPAVLDVTTPVTIGRERSSGIILEDTLSSRQHARVEFADGGWYIQDLGSANGTFVNSARIQRQALKAGDQIQIGTTIFWFE